jgi:hypothetical protein
MSINAHNDGFTRELVILKVNLGFNLSFTFNPQFHPQLLVTLKPNLGINET